MFLNAHESLARFMLSTDTIKHVWIAVLFSGKIQIDPVLWQLFYHFNLKESKLLLAGHLKGTISSVKPWTYSAFKSLSIPLTNNLHMLHWQEMKVFNFTIHLRWLLTYEDVSCQVILRRHR